MKTICLFLWKWPGINRYIMECKLRSNHAIIVTIPELIDTLWNVNIATAVIGSSAVIGINRYIMECKYIG